MVWQSKEQLLELLTYLMECKSITGSLQEKEMARKMYDLLQQLPYFRRNPSQVKLYPIGDDYHFVGALVKKTGVTKTIVLLSHFDVVDVEDYGKWKDLAFSPNKLTQELHKSNELPRDVQEDIADGNWLFGRGSMDMKSGIALHLAMVEQACEGAFDGNVLFISVPDEEANSLGMRNAVSVLNNLKEAHGLTYTACLNSEPTFSKYPGDIKNYFYTGSIGKVLAGFYCYGKETHVGEPLSGLNANLIASYVTKEMEWNEAFSEESLGETAPPPTNLMQRDLKEGYSVKIPHAAVSVFNVLLMDNQLDQMQKMLLKVATLAANHVEDHLKNRSSKWLTYPEAQPVTVQVTTYEKLLKQAIERFGEREIKDRLARILHVHGDKDDRELTIKLVDEIASLLKENGPMIVLYFSPPFYPAVCSSADPTIARTASEVKAFAASHGVDLSWQHYFQGLSDLSYTGITEELNSLLPLTNNMPLFPNGYHLPIEELKQLQVPVMNVGPLGRDPHKWTERVEIDYTFGVLMEILPFTIKSLLKA